MQKKHSILIFILLALLLSAAAGFAGYWLLSNQTETNAKEQTALSVQQAATLVNQQFYEWQSATVDISTAPTNPPKGATMRLLPAEGIPTDLSYSEQDLLARSRFGKTGAEVTSTSDTTKSTMQEQSYSIIKPLLSGEFLLLRFSLTPLKEKLVPLVAENQSLAISQTTNNQTTNAIHIHSEKSKKFENFALSDAQWSINASYDAPKTAITPKHIGLGLFALFGLLTAVPLILKYQKLTSLDKQLAAQKAAKEAAKKASKSKQHKFELESDGSLEAKLAKEIDLQSAHQQTISQEDKVLDEDLDETTKDIFDELDSETKSNDAKSQDTQSDQCDDNNPITFEQSAVDLKQAADSETLRADAQLDRSNMIEYDAGSTSTLNDELRRLFRAYDIRGDAKLIDDISFITVLAGAFANVFKHSKVSEVVIGHDTRKTGQGIAQMLINQLLAQGVNILDIGLTTTPMLAFATKENKGAGIMVTASHSSPDDNGFKWFINNQSPTSEDIQALAALCEQPTNTSSDSEHAEGQHYIQPYQQLYLDAITEDIILADLMTVGVDCMHGSTSLFVKDAFETVGCIVEAYNTNTDGNFTSGQPNPIAQDRLTEFCAQIASLDCNIGFAFDADGDRLAVIDSNGSVISSEQLICLLSQMMLETNQSADIIFDIKCSKIVNQTISKHGGLPRRLPTGNTHLRRALFSNDYRAKFAGELSGHFIFNDNRLGNHDDALYAALRLCEWLTRSQTTLAELVARLPKQVSTQDHYISYKQQQDQQSIIDTLIQNWHQNDNHAGIMLDTTDGFRLDTETSFGIIRLSNTSDQLNFRFSAGSQDELNQIIGLFTEQVNLVDAELAEQISNTVLQEN